MATLSGISGCLLRIIVDELSLVDTLNLSSASHQLRAVLASQVFKTVTFSHDARTADSAYLCAQKYGPHISNFEFRIVVSRDALPDGQASRDGAPPDGQGPPDEEMSTMPASATELLKGCKELVPNLYSISLKFVFPEFTNMQDLFRYDINEKEDHSPRWAQVASLTWNILAQHNPTKKLLIDSFLTSVRHCRIGKPWEFWEFPDRALEHLELRISRLLCGFENLDPFEVMLFSSTASITAGLYLLAFKFIKKLKIQGDPILVLGHDLQGTSTYSPFKLVRQGMPFLEELELENMRLDKSFGAFLKRSSALRSLTLTQVGAGCWTDPSRGSPICPEADATWEYIFNGMVSKGTSISKISWTPIWVVHEGDKAHVKGATNISQTRNLSPMTFACSDLKHAFCHYEFDKTDYSSIQYFPHFDPQKDLPAYDRLMEVVRANWFKEEEKRLAKVSTG